MMSKITRCIKRRLWVLIVFFLYNSLYVAPTRLRKAPSERNTEINIEIGKINLGYNVRDIVNRLKELSNIMLTTKRKLHMKVKMNKYIEKRYPISQKESHLGKGDPSSKLKGSLIYLSKLVLFATKSTNQFNIYSILSLYYKMYISYEDTPAVLFRIADAWIILYHFQNSIQAFNNAISALNGIISNPNVTDHHLKYALDRATYLYVDSGKLSKAYTIQEKLATKFPNDSTILKRLADFYMKAGKISEASTIYERCLLNNPNDSYSSATMGYIFYEMATRRIINASEVNKYLEIGAKLMKKGMASKNKETIINEFYLSWSDCLRRLKRYEEAEKVVHMGVQESVFHNQWQRSKYFIKHLTSKPSWKLEETGIEVVLQNIKKNWKKIKKEALDIFQKELYPYYPDLEKIRGKGTWRVFKLYANGKRIINTKTGKENCLYVPLTCKLLNGIPFLPYNSMGSSSFSLLSSGSHVAPHSGPSNTRLRVHLGLDIPEQKDDDNLASFTKLRVGNEYLTWKNGEMLIWDDSYDHEVWHYHPKNHSRLIFMVDLWHPELTIKQIAEIILNSKYDNIFINKEMG